LYAKPIKTLKKIGILYGQERSFPQAFVEEINARKLKGITAEPVSIDFVEQGRVSDYAVIIDRISQDVPFYRALLKNAAISGTAVINNPFWWSADEKFFNNALAVKLGIPVPKTVLLPSFAHPEGTTGESFTNLSNMDWEAMHNQIGYPAFMKPHAGGGWKSVFKLDSKEDFFANHPTTGELCMMFQEAIDFTDYYRCYCLDRKNVHVMAYEPRNPHHLRYVAPNMSKEKALIDKITEYVLALNVALGYDFNTVEFAVRDGIPYAIDFCNPAPDADVHSVGQENFDWIVKNAADMAIEKAKAYKEGVMNLTWGSFVQTSVNNGTVLPVVSSETKKTATKKVQEAISETPEEAPAKKTPGRRKKSE